MAFVKRILLGLLLCFSAIFAEEVNGDSTAAAAQDSTVAVTQDSTVAASSDSSAAHESEESSGFSIRDVVAWPFVHILQPIFGVAIYPVAQPIHYAFDNGVIEKSVELITFGENKNILIYPAMNLKPGTSTMLGAVYRHRSILLNHDYLVLEPYYFANGDWYLGFRYTKQGIFGLPLYVAFRAQRDMNRDAYFIIPGTKEQFVQPDSSTHFNWRLSFPLNKSETWNMSFATGIDLMNASLPTNAKDSILIDEKFPIESRGLYQSYTEIPLEFGLVFDNLDYSYAPTRGSRMTFSAKYNFVRDYEGVKYDAVWIADDDGDGVPDEDGREMHKAYKFKDDGNNHDYIRTELVFQHYFYLGKTKNFHLSVKEARQNRKFYLDFSLDETLRTWRPENVFNTLFERRVLAFQFRMTDIWEMEKGETPYAAFPWMNTRFPMRGYNDAWAANHVMGLSMEYRWPIDRFVDGVVFNEYGMHTNEFDEWSFDRYYNSWGFGVRVRQPNMYFFRIQFGFHGLNGVNLVMTIAPEYR